MINDRITNLKYYISSELIEKLSEFLNSIDENILEGEYPILEDKIFARVMSYDTKQPKDCVIEAHNKYIDIQATILGAEGISVYQREKLTDKEPYAEDKDIELFEGEKAVPYAHTVNLPGYFTMLFPDEAHRPQEQVNSHVWVKKFVIKVAVECMKLI